MGLETIWERELKWPRSGPLHWLTMYCFVVICVGFVLWYALSFVSPTAPDVASGKVYRVPNRRAPDFYVDRWDAYALRFAIIHLGMVAVLGGTVGVWNAGAKRPQRSE